MKVFKVFLGKYLHENRISHSWNICLFMSLVMARINYTRHGEFTHFSGYPHIQCWPALCGIGLCGIGSGVLYWSMPGTWVFDFNHIAQCGTIYVLLTRHAIISCKHVCAMRSYCCRTSEKGIKHEYKIDCNRCLNDSVQSYTPLSCKFINMLCIHKTMALFIHVLEW